MTQNFLRKSIAQHVQVIQSVEGMAAEIDRVASLCADALGKSRKIVFCGNGGSAADSQHLAGELLGRLKIHRRPLAALALTGDSVVTTCIANDYGYEEVFARQVEGLCQAGDVLFTLSTSGTSRSAVRAVEMANSLGVTTVGLLGGTGGVLAAACNISLCVQSTTHTARIQEAHMLIGHAICALIEHYLGLTPLEDQ